MTRLMEYFHTDWDAMTRNDWIGMSLTILAFVAMIAIYMLVFNPRNKEAFDAHGKIALRDEGEHNNSGGKNER